MIETVFLITAAIALICALITVTSHNVVHALLFMVLMMLAIALIFFLIGAPFAAALQIIIYAGAIMVLFVFVTMMLHQGDVSLAQERQLFSLTGSWLPLCLSLVLLFEVIIVALGSPTSTSTANGAVINTDSTKEIGALLFGPYHQLIVLAALMLLSALISAIHISKASVSKSRPTTVRPNSNEEQA